MWLSACWGGVCTPLLVLFLMRFISWQKAFAIFGALGIIWAVFFFRWYRDDPANILV
jgi:sugar phosphate permease